MPKIADAFVEIEARTGKYKADISQAKRITAGFGASATKSIKRITIGLGAMAVAAGVAATVIGVKLTKAIIRAGSAVIQTAIRFDKLRIGMIAITGSAKEAERQIERLRVLSLKPGLGFEQALQGSISLQAAGIQAAVAERSLAAFGNALAVIGKGAPELSRVNLQLSQIAAKTSGFGADLRVLREAIPAIGPALQRAFNNKPVEDITISGIELIKVLTAELEKLGQAGDSVGNNINNLKTSFTVLKATIGKTLLGITSDTAKALTDILDNIVLIIPVWQSVQDDIAVVFQEILKLTLTATGEIMKGMFRIISAAAPLIFKPLTNSAKKFFRDFAAGFSVSVNEVMRAARVITQKEYETFLVELVNANQEANNKSAENFKKEYEAAINSAVNVSIKELPRIGKVFGQTLEQIASLVKGIAAKIPKVEIDTAEVEKAVLPIIDLAGAFKTFGFVIEANKKAFSALGGEIKKNITAAEEAIFKAKLVAKELADVIRDAMEKSAKAVTDALQPAFENLFENLFSGNTKSLWEQFWADLKRIAIRQIAQIAAAQVLTGLFGGGPASGKGGGGFGSFLSSFAPLLTAINPAVGGLAAAGGFLAGKLEQPKSQQFNFFQTDFANLDQTRIEKTVSQQILPSLEEERTDGR